ncbi:hypothetical protein APED_03335 [Acanthopleuribacter pedis]
MIPIVLYAGELGLFIISLSWEKDDTQFQVYIVPLYLASKKGPTSITEKGPTVFVGTRIPGSLSLR